MVVHAFPAAKLGALLIKQISKPIANYVKVKAKSHPTFRKYICLPPAHFYNWCERKTKMWLLAMGQPVNIEILNEAAAIDLGANLVGEAVIFIIAAGILIAEYNRSSRKEAAKEAAKQAEMDALRDAIKDLFIQTEEQGAHIREISRKLGELETRGGGRSLYPRNTEPPPPPPPGNITPRDSDSSAINTNHEELLANIDLMRNNNRHNPLKGVILKAVDNVETEFFIDRTRKREPGVITVALNQLYKDVYRIPLSF